MLPRRFLALMLLAAAAAADQPVSVVDGDTIRIGAERIRIAGIDAPESNQTCKVNGQAWPLGQFARAELVRLIGDRAPVCRAQGADAGGKAIAVCSVDGRDLGEAMVRAGMARDLMQESKGAYLSAELEALAAHRGIWKETCDAPRDWQAAKRQQ